MGSWGHSQGHTHNTTCSCVQKHKDARHRVTGRYQGIKHTHADKHPGTRGYTVRGTPGAFFQRKPRAMVTQTDTNIHTPSYRHRGTKMANTITHSVTPWQSYSEPHTFRNEEAKTRAQTGKYPQGQPETGTTGTLRNTPGQGWHLLRYTPPTTPTRAGSHWSTWGHAHRRGGGDRAAPAHLAPPALPQAPAGAPSVRARVCVPVRACPLVRAATCGRRGAHCARGGPAVRRGGNGCHGARSAAAY